MKRISHARPLFVATAHISAEADADVFHIVMVRDPARAATTGGVTPCESESRGNCYHTAGNTDAHSSNADGCGGGTGHVSSGEAFDACGSVCFAVKVFHKRSSSGDGPVGPSAGTAEEDSTCVETSFASAATAAQLDTRYRTGSTESIHSSLNSHNLKKSRRNSTSGGCAATSVAAVQMPPRELAFLSYMKHTIQPPHRHLIRYYGSVAPAAVDFSRVQGSMDLATEAWWARANTAATSTTATTIPRCGSCPTRADTPTLPVFEYAVGGPIHRFLQTCGPVATGVMMMRWFQQAAEALLCLHAHGIVHGDIRPENILMRLLDSVESREDSLNEEESTSGAEIALAGFSHATICSNRTRRGEEGSTVGGGTPSSLSSLRSMHSLPAVAAAAAMHTAMQGESFRAPELTAIARGYPTHTSHDSAASSGATFASDVYSLAASFYILLTAPLEELSMAGAVGTPYLHVDYHNKADPDRHAWVTEYAAIMQICGRYPTLADLFMSTVPFRGPVVPRSLLTTPASGLSSALTGPLVLMGGMPTYVSPRREREVVVAAAAAYVENAADSGKESSRLKVRNRTEEVFAPVWRILGWGEDCRSGGSDGGGRDMLDADRTMSSIPAETCLFGCGCSVIDAEARHRRAAPAVNDSSTFSHDSATRSGMIAWHERHPPLYASYRDDPLKQRLQLYEQQREQLSMRSESGLNGTEDREASLNTAEVWHDPVWVGGGGPVPKVEQEEHERSLSSMAANLRPKGPLCAAPPYREANREAGHRVWLNDAWASAPSCTQQQRQQPTGELALRHMQENVRQWGLPLRFLMLLDSMMAVSPHQRPLMSRVVSA